MPKTILMLLTSHDTLGATGKPTGLWLEELAAPYYAFQAAGFTLSLASPRGGKPPLDPGSTREAPEVARRFLDDPAALGALAATRRIADMAEEFDAYFVVGGHGVMWDLATDGASQRLLGRAAGAGKIVSAVCHGPAALVDVKLPNGEYLVANKRVAGFSNEEENAVKLSDVVPFLLETRLAERGARYESGPRFTEFFRSDQLLVTGQNPQSSLAVAREVCTLLGATVTR